MTTSVFINEFHYDNDGTDTGEFIEIFGPSGFDLTGWSIVLYNGSNQLVYNVVNLTNIIPNSSSGYGTLVINFPSNGIQNGSPDGIALVDNTGNVVQFISYEGSFTALDGAAAGLTSVDIGVSESSSTPVGFSLQLTGTGRFLEDFTWSQPSQNTPGSLNNNQTISGVSNTPNIIINEIDADQIGTDAAEFVELYDGGVGNTSLNGLILVLYNGSNDTVYNAIDLTGNTTNADGYFVIGSANVANVDLIAFTTNGIQNGADAVALYQGNLADFSNGTTITTDNLIDAVVYGTNDSDDAELLTLLNPGQGQVNESGGANGSTGDSIQRIPNGSGGQLNTDSFQALTPTPGTENITPPPVDVITPIYDIQSIGHTSTLVGENVVTTGIVTAVEFNGFYVQDATGDNNNNTSDAIFVFTGSNPNVSIADAVEIQGTVTEFIPGGAATGNLSTTQITGANITVLSSNNPLPTAVVIGVDRIPPTQIIDNDNFSVFDPDEDGIDFYESLEGMRVTVKDAIAVSPTNRFGEIFTLANNGIGATGVSNRGTINISPDDFNPERIQIQLDNDLTPNFSANVNVGDILGDVTGVVDYSFGNFEVKATEVFTPTSGNLTPEVTNLIGTENQLTVATFNVLNLDPNDNDGDSDIANGQLTKLAQQIVNNLQNPDIIGLQEIQDNDGSVNSSITSADATLQLLIDEISTLSGIQYQFIDNPFIGDDTNGGQPGGNIRTAFLYNPNRVSFVEGSLTSITDSNDQQTNNSNPFFNSRLPLAANFIFNGEEITVVNNHFSSKGGSQPLFGQTQPSVTNQPLSGQEDPNINGSLNERQAQANTIKNFVDGILSNDANANVIVLGDLNEFEFISPLETLETSLNNLTETLPENERYSYSFQGNSQSLDHILVSDSLFLTAEFDAVHTNSEFFDQASDHDPLLARFTIEQPVNIITGTNNGDRLSGTEGKDEIYGLAGSDRIIAGGGNDIIVGGESIDFLFGGEGADIFVKSSINDGLDFIMDFNPLEDKVDLSQIIAGSNYSSANPFPDYLSFTSIGAITILSLDPNGDANNFFNRPAIFFSGVNSSELSAENFIF